MEQTNQLSLTEHNPISPMPPVTVRDLLAIGFRHKHLLVGTFFAVALLG